MFKFKQLRILVFLLFLFQAINSSSLCPAGNQTFNQFQSISKVDSKAKSGDLNAFYSIKKSGTKYKILGYKIETFDKGQTKNFNAVSFQGNLSAGSEIVSVSKKGSCVGVLIDNDQFIAFQTSTKAFKQIQKFNTKSYQSKKFQTSDDCSTIHMKYVQNGTQILKIYGNSLQSNQTFLSTKYMFDKNLQYGISSFGELLILQNGSYTTKLTNTTFIKLSLISVNYNQQLNTLVSITQNDQKIYSLLIINLGNITNMFNKIFTPSNFTTQLIFQIKPNNNQNLIILSKDHLGLNNFIQLSIDQNKKLLVNQYIFESNSQYKSIIDVKSVTSVSDRILFVYQNKKMYHFGFYQNRIFYISQMEVNIEKNMKDFYVKNNNLEPQTTFALFSPNKLKSCNIFKSNTTANSTQSQLQSSDIPTQVIDSNGLVAKCNLNCQNCNTGGKCTICVSGYVLKSGQCISCEGCRSCNPDNISICYQCYSPQILNESTNFCIKMSCANGNCFECNSENKCTFCKPGYSILLNQCKKCQIEGCKNCSNNINFCDFNSCSEGYIYYPNPITNLSSCIKCSTGCQNCLLTDISSCTQCYSGFYLQKDSSSTTNSTKCYKCLQNCKYCTNKTICLQCSSGMKLNSNKTACISTCSDNCLTCNQSSPTKCQSCFADNILKSQSCVPDLSCNSTQNCSSCASPSYINYNRYCYKCNYTDSNCISCNYPSLSVCSKCLSSYYLTPQNSCSKCPTQCSHCITYQSCYKCSVGYYFFKNNQSSTGSCLKCNNQCKSCFLQADICTNCKIDYFLNNTKCISKNQVEISLVINMPLQSVIVILEQLIDWVVKKGNKYRTLDVVEPYGKKDFYIMNLKSGSAVLYGVISTQTAKSTSSVTDGLMKEFGLSSPSFNGYQVISMSAKSVFDNSNNNSHQTINNLTQNHEQVNSNLVIIICITIPCAAIIIILVIVVVERIRKRNKKKKFGDGVKEKSPVNLDLNIGFQHVGQSSRHDFH